MVILKLILSYHTLGTNDVVACMICSDTVRNVGILHVYTALPRVNNAPLFVWIGAFAKLLEFKSNLSYPYLFRLLPIFADFVSIFVIWELLKKHKINNKIFIAMLCAISPINFLVSGFHGNYDAVFILLVLLAIYFAENDNIVVSACMCAFSIGIKLVPIMLVPLFMYCLRGRYKKMLFSSVLLVVLLAVYVPFLISDSRSLIKSVFLYKSDPYNWGIWKVVSFLSQSPNIFVVAFSQSLEKFYLEYGMSMFRIVIAVAPLALVIHRKLNLIEGTFAAFSIFLIFTPGFGVQYLLWLSFFSIMVMPLLGTIYVFAGGFYLSLVYILWGAGRPPYFANARIDHGLLPLRITPYLRFENGILVFGLVVWIIIVAMLAIFLFTKRITAPRNNSY